MEDSSFSISLSLFICSIDFAVPDIKEVINSAIPAKVSVFKTLPNKAIAAVFFAIREVNVVEKKEKLVKRAVITGIRLANAPTSFVPIVIDNIVKTIFNNPTLSITFTRTVPNSTNVLTVSEDIVFFHIFWIEEFSSLTCP